MNDKYKYVPYILIVLMLAFSTFFYQKWDSEKKEKASLVAKYNTEKSLIQVEKKNEEALLKAQQQNEAIAKKISKLDSKLSELNKKEKSIKAPSKEQYDEIQKANLVDLYKLYSSMGYPVKIKR